MITAAGCVLLVLAAADEITSTNQLGPVSVTVSLAPAEPVIGDEIVFQIRVEAAADVEVLMPEFGEALNRYTILDYVPKRRIRDDGTSVLTQRYTLQPAASGPQSIPPILIEFVDNRPGQQPAPDDLDAYELLTERIDFTVQSVLPDDAARALKPPLGELDLTADRGQSWRWGAWAAAAGLLLAGPLLGWWWRKRRRRVRRRSAYELARRRLDQLLTRPWPSDEAEIDAFFVSISSIVRRYLEDRFELRAPELTTEEFLALAGTASDLSREHQALLRDFLRQADLVKFAGAEATETEMRRSTELAGRFLEETRENAPLIEDRDAAVVGARNPRAAAADRKKASDTVAEEEHV